MKASDIVPVCISAAVPGGGHIAAGRPARGLALLFLFGCAVDGILYAKAQSTLPPEYAAPGTYYAALIGALLLWAFAIGDTTAMTLRRRRIEAQADQSDAHIRQALAAYLGEHYDAATEALRAALRIDREDPDALFYAGVVHAAAGRRRQARRALRACLRHDHDGQWDDEAVAHLRALDATPPPAASEAAAPSPGQSDDASTPPRPPAEGTAREEHLETTS